MDSSPWSLGAGYYPVEAKGIASLASYGLGLASVLLLFGSILAHEFGHALVARRRGVEIEEIEIDERRFRSLWPLTDGRRIRKTRYLIPTEHGLTLELDVYHGNLAGLVTAEVEFDSPEEAAAFTPPAWLGRELTDDPRYKNKRLATAGLPA